MVVCSDRSVAQFKPSGDVKSLSAISTLVSLAYEALASFKTRTSVVHAFLEIHQKASFLTPQDF